MSIDTVSSLANQNRFQRTDMEDNIMNMKEKIKDQVLVLGATGKTGRRIVERLNGLGVPVRIGSRAATPTFSWEERSSWDRVLNGVSAIYISYAPDLAVPGASDAISALVNQAIAHGVKRIVLLSGRGEAEAQRCEAIIQRDEIDWTVVRASWFMQNFSEGVFMEMVLAGEVTLPAGDVREPFIDADDIADVAVAALTEQDWHSGQVYEVTGPRLLTFAEAVDEIARATGREIRYQQIPVEAYVAGAKAAGLPNEYLWLLEYLFTTMLDGHNACLTDGVQRALGREPRDFSDYARSVAATGVWEVEEKIAKRV